MKQLVVGCIVLAVSCTVLAHDMPDLTKGEGPAIESAAQNDWYLHCAGCRGWAHRDAEGSSDAARQILVTKVPTDSAVRRQLKVGDVILGVNGQPFTDRAIRRFRDVSRPAQESEGRVPMILWRKDWGEARQIVVSLAPLPIDFTHGDKPGKSRDWNLGPTGARGWIQASLLATASARQILVTEVEKGSPADGLLEKGDVILGLDRARFESDARKALAHAITRAETKKGNGWLHLLCWRDGKESTVTIPLPVLGSYARSAPFSCRKSARIVDAAAAYIVKHGLRDGINGCVNALGLLATGDEAYIPAVREFTLGLDKDVKGMHAWHLGYANILLAEYYLATGDEDALPKVHAFSQTIAEGQSRMGTYGHGFADPATGVLAGYGAVNQPAITCALSLALARKCGVESEAVDRAIERAEIFFSYYINKGSIPYGDHQPYDETHDNNGVCSSVAVFFDLSGHRKGARFFSRMATASYGIREAGHTGHFWSHLWAAPGVNRAGRKAAAGFLKELWWYFDLERRWDGGFAYQAAPGSNGDSTWGWDCTGARLLVYTLPRKKLYITGRHTSRGNRLTGRKLRDTLAAGKGVSWGTRKSIYDGLEQQALLELLTSWSPIVRTRAAKSLGKQPENAVPALLALYRDGDENAKLGALAALRYQGKRAASAVTLLTDLLTHEESNMRIAAMNALSGMGTVARPAVPEMLRVASMTFPDDPRNLTRRNLCYVLFAPDILDVETIDRDKLFTAVRDLIRVDDGRARGRVAALYTQLSFEELLPILPDILWAAENPSPSGIMFAAGIRDAGLKLLSENRVESGIPLLAQYARNQQQWGSQKRIVAIMSMLENYGAHAKAVLPELRELAEFCRTEPGFPEWARKEKRTAVEDAIQRIETATEKPNLLKLE